MTPAIPDALIPEDIKRLYEVHNYRNAAQVLATGCAEEWADLLEALRAFRLTVADIRKPGGNESDIPKRVSGLLRAKGWKETRIKGDLLITMVAGSSVAATRKPKAPEEADEEEAESETLQKIDELARRGDDVRHVTRKNFLDGHKVDYVKRRVAFDLEWNSKDQTFDRDLYAFRAFHDCDLIDAAVLMTRGGSLNAVFDRLGAEVDTDGNARTDKHGRPKLVKTKYGASTTWMGKLLYRLDAGRHGGCPVLALGITPALITDWNEDGRHRSE